MSYNEEGRTNERLLMAHSVVISGLVKIILGYVSGERIPSFSKSEVWTVVHVALAIVCASLPLYRPLVTRVSQSILVTRLETTLLGDKLLKPSRFRLGYPEKRSSGGFGSGDANELLERSGPVFRTASLEGGVPGTSSSVRDIFRGRTALKGSVY